MSDYRSTPGYKKPTAITAAGTTQANAAALEDGALNYATGDATVGVILPAAAAGASCSVYNLHATLGLKVYPHSGGDINDGTTDASITIEGKTLALFVCVDGTTWAAIYTVNT